MWFYQSFMKSHWLSELNLKIYKEHLISNILISFNTLSGTKWEEYYYNQHRK